MICRTNYVSILASAVALTVASTTWADMGAGKMANGWSFAGQQLKNTDSWLATNKESTGRTYTNFPTIGNSGASSGTWGTAGLNDWRNGFLPGQYWFMANKTGDSTYLNLAKNYTNGLATDQNWTGSHDVGFMINTSWGNAYNYYKAQGDTTNMNIAAGVITNAAASLNTRYNTWTNGSTHYTTKMGAFSAWDGSSMEAPAPVIMDTMMNIEVLFKAHQINSNATTNVYYANAIQHALTTAAQNVRLDGSSYHVVRHYANGYSTGNAGNSGQVFDKKTRQGFDDESTWSRGESWGVYGFTMAYRYTKDDPTQSANAATFLSVAQAMADYTIGQLPTNLDPAMNPRNYIAGDYVTPSDFDAERGTSNKGIQGKDGLAWANANDDSKYNDTTATGTGLKSGRHYTNDRFDATGTYTSRDTSATAITADALLELSTYMTDPTLKAKYYNAAENMLNSLLTWDNPDSRLNYLAEGTNQPGILARGSANYGDANTVSTSYGDYYLLEAMTRYEATPQPEPVPVPAALGLGLAGLVSLASVNGIRRMIRKG